MRLSLLAATALVLALPAVAQAGNFDGFYAGAQVGGAFTSIKADQVSPVYNGGGTNTDALAANGVVGGVFGGYGQTLSKSFYLGGEFDATFGNREYSYKITDPTNPYSSKIKTGTEWGLSVRPGYVINDNALVYGLLGVAFPTLKSSSSAPEVTFNKTQTAFRLGLGTEVSISGPLTLRADYAHSFLANVTVADSYGQSITYKPSEDTVKIGVAYHF
jgi:opacity protein-like surface antigen